MRDSKMPTNMPKKYYMLSRKAWKHLFSFSLMVVASQGAAGMRCKVSELLCVWDSLSGTAFEGRCNRDHHHHGMCLGQATFGEKQPHLSLYSGEALVSSMYLNVSEAKGAFEIFISIQQPGGHPYSMSGSAVLCCTTFLPRSSKPFANKLPDKRRACLLCRVPRGYRE